MDLIIIFIIIYVLYNKYFQNSSITEYKLNTLFKVQHFSNIKRDSTIPGMLLITADSRGENYLFAKKIIPFSIIDINTIYEKAQKDHIHNIVILHSNNAINNNLLEKIKEYNIQIWDNKKIDSLITSPSTSSILQTSNTSDDTCKIDNNQFEPIQEPTSFWKNLFKKPDRL